MNQNEVDLVFVEVRFSNDEFVFIKVSTKNDDGSNCTVENFQEQIASIISDKDETLSIESVDGNHYTFPVRSILYTVVGEVKTI